jgi:hypothetical protein
LLIKAKIENLVRKAKEFVAPPLERRPIGCHAGRSNSIEGKTEASKGSALVVSSSGQ